MGGGVTGKMRKCKMVCVCLGGMLVLLGGVCMYERETSGG